MALIFLSLFINIHTQTQVFLLRKNIVLVFYLVFAFSHGQVFSNQDQIHLGIDLGKVLSLSVNPAQTVVNLDYSTSENFLEGVTAEEDNHLQIFSNVGFVINVYAINIANIDLSSIKIKAGEATDNPLPGSAEYSSVSTETMPQTIVKCECNLPFLSNTQK